MSAAVEDQQYDKRMENAHQWYLRLGIPTRDKMTRQIASTAGCDLLVADIERLPWNERGTRVDNARFLISMSTHHGSRSRSRDYGNVTEDTTSDDASDSSEASFEMDHSDHETDTSDFSADSPVRIQGVPSESVFESLSRSLGELSCDLGFDDDVLEDVTKGLTFHDLFDSDIDVVETILETMQQFVDEDLGEPVKENRKFEKLFISSGGCEDFVKMLKKQLDKVTAMVPGHKKIKNWSKDTTEEKVMRELKILALTLKQVCTLTCSPCDVEETIRVEFTKAGAIRPVVKIMKAFPKCAELQWDGCVTLWNLLQSISGKRKGIKAGAMEILLAAAKQHPKNANICNDALDTLGTLIEGNPNYSQMLLELGGIAQATSALQNHKAGTDAHIAAQRLLSVLVVRLQIWITDGK